MPIYLSLICFCVSREVNIIFVGGGFDNRKLGCAFTYDATSPKGKVLDKTSSMY